MSSPSFPLADFSTAAAKRDHRFIIIPMHRTLPEIMEANQRDYGEYRALFFDGHFITNTALFEDTRRLAAVLRDAGVQKGDRVVVNLPNCPEIWIGYLACSLLGAAIVPTVPALTIDELSFVVSDCGPSAIVTTRDKADHFKAACANFPSVRVVLAGGRNEPELMAALKAAAPLRDPATVDPEDLGAIIYTSGTTGKPKGVMLRQRSLCRQACLNYGFYIGPGDDPRIATLLMPLPMCHIFGLEVALTSLLMGNLMVVMERFDPAQAIQLVKAHQVRVVPAVPTMLIRFLAADGAVEACRSVVQWDCGGSALPVELLEQVERTLGGLVTEGWGLSEASSAVVQNVPGVPRKAGSVGLILPGLELEVRTLDGRPCKANEHGELLVRGETLMQGYWNRPEATANALKPDGFLRTGDIGYVDEDDYCYIVGRKDDLIIRGGQNISPRELEEVIQEYPTVREVAVVGLPDKEFGHIAGAFIIPQAGATLDQKDLLAFCGKKLARHKIPGRIVVLDQLPYNSTGKVIKEELRRRYAS